MPRPLAGEGHGGWAMPRLTPTAWRLGFLALGLLAAAVNTGNNLIYLLFSLLAATLPVSLGIGAINLRRQRFELRLPAAPRVGAPFAIDVTITTGRRWFAARSIELTVLTDQEDLGPAFVERIDAGSTVQTALLGHCSRRGPLKILGLAVRSRYPLGLIERRRVFEYSDELLILPRTRRAALPSARSTHDPGT